MKLVSLLKKYSQCSHILNEEDQKVDVTQVDALLANYKPAQGGCRGSIIAVSSLGIFNRSFNHQKEEKSTKID